MEIIKINECDMVFIKDNKQNIWYSANNAAECIGYKSPKKAIERFIPIKYKKKFEELNIDKSVKTNKKIQNKSIFLNLEGLKILIKSSKLIGAIEMAKHFDITCVDKVLTKECTLLLHITKFLKNIGYSYMFQNIFKNHNTDKIYRTDLYISECKLVIEIDEHNHKQYDKYKDKIREKYIKKYYKVKFLRFNPDDKKLLISDVLGKITNFIFNKNINKKKNSVKIQTDNNIFDESEDSDDD